MNKEEETSVEEHTKIDDGIGSPKVVILWNDDYNTFEHVEKCLIKICKHTPEEAHMSALIVHFKGKCIVAEGSENYLKKIKLRLKAEGLSVTLEKA